MQQIIDQILYNSQEYINNTEKKNRKKKGQFFTPYAIAQFMAGLVKINKDTITLLDPGAGTGLLTLAIVEDIASKELVKSISIDLFENDIELIPVLRNNLQLLQVYCTEKDIELSYNISNENFITYNQERWKNNSTSSTYDIIVGNPPYQKLRNDSEEAQTMKSIVYGQCNSYFLFLAMAIHLLNPSGNLVFILPRSFLSGKYFEKFRQWMLKRVSIEYIHNFKSRYKIFHGEIIQEVVIVKLVKKRQSEQIQISSSESDVDLHTSDVITVNNEVIIENSKMLRIRIPMSDYDVKLINLFDKLKHTLGDFGMKFCTGPIVDFRTKSYIREIPNSNTVPLLWSCNFNGTYISWPKSSLKFIQYIEIDEKIKQRLIPNRNYVLVKRVLTREGKKRIRVNLYAKQGDFKYIGIENHINYLYYPDGINEPILKGIYIFLNSSYCESYIRIINGTTQLNASELNNIPIPSLAELEEAGNRMSKKIFNTHKTVVDFGVEESSFDFLSYIDKN